MVIAFEADRAVLAAGFPFAYFGAFVRGRASLPSLAVIAARPLSRAALSLVTATTVTAAARGGFSVRLFRRFCSWACVAAVSRQHRRPSTQPRRALSGFLVACPPTARRLPAAPLASPPPLRAGVQYLLCFALQCYCRPLKWCLRRSGLHPLPCLFCTIVTGGFTPGPPIIGCALPAGSLSPKSQKKMGTCWLPSLLWLIIITADWLCVLVI